MKKLEELSTLPVLAEDQSLSSSVRVLDPTSPCFVKSVREVLHHVGDRYRISRRILRNRRNQLLDIELDLRISRRLRRLPHQPGQLELDARSAVRRLLQTLRSAEIPSSVLIPLSRQLFQSLCDPSCLLAMLALARCRDLRLANWSECDGQIGYDEWEDYAATLWDAAGPELSAEALDDAQRAADAWQAGGGRQNRVEKLTGFLRAQHLRAPSRKFLIFAGFPGLASRLTEAIVGEFGNPSVARFGWDMQTKIKEKEVIRFRRDNLCWIMVSDETGGEGRNFQFVDELIHFDLPWYAARIEQRIGRLDRLGREEPEVCSNVLFAAGEEEEGWLRCLESGLQLFARSISGLEFALAELERQIVHAAIADGSEGMDLLLNEIKQKAEAERAEDDVQGMLDAASIERASAEIFRRGAVHA